MKFQPLTTNSRHELTIKTVQDFMAEPIHAILVDFNQLYLIEPTL